MAYPNRPFLYACKDPHEPHCYWFHGITFNNFQNAIPLRRNLLLLEPATLDDVDLIEDRNTRFAVITPAQIPQLATLDLYKQCGDFVWVDLPSRRPLSSLPPHEFASLLYLARTFKALASPFFPSLRNRFAYLAHDDGYVLKLYARHPQDIAQLLAAATRAKARKFLNQTLRQKNLGNLLLPLTKKGLLLDFRPTANTTPHLQIHTPGLFQNMDDLHSKIQKKTHSGRPYFSWKNKVVKNDNKIFKYLNLIRAALMIFA